MAKRYPQPDLAAINSKRLRAHYYEIHKAISQPQRRMDAYKGWKQDRYYVDCVGCMLFRQRLKINIPFGYCGKWYSRVLMWFYLCWWRIRHGPRAWRWWLSLEMWYMHYTGKWCTWIEKGRCVGCNRKRDDLQSGQ